VISLSKGWVGDKAATQSPLSLGRVLPFAVKYAEVWYLLQA